MGTHTPQRQYRCPDETYDPAVAIAKLRGENLSGDVIRPALERYVRRHRELLDADKAEPEPTTV